VAWLARHVGLAAGRPRAEPATAAAPAEGGALKCGVAQPISGTHEASVGVQRGVGQST
jgi:hypothetical protein